jgi:hypothetical protein
VDPTIKPPPLWVRYDLTEDEEGFNYLGWRMLEPDNPRHPDDLQKMLIVDGEVMQTMATRMGDTVAYNHEGQLLDPFGRVAVREDDEEDEREEPRKFVNYYIDYY